MNRLLPAAFFNRPPQRVAQELLGTSLIRLWRGHRLGGRIVETEAYDGPHDLACHASKGRTPRTAVMFGPAGYTYVYFTYGMHWCLNVVTGPIGYPAAVLIRAIEPLEGLPFMVQGRRQSDPSLLTNGPSRVCQALALTGVDNNQPLDTSTGLWIEQGTSPREAVATSARVGVDYAKAYRLKPWRYFIQDNPFVSHSR